MWTWPGSLVEGGRGCAQGSLVFLMIGVAVQSWAAAQQYTQLRVHVGTVVPGQLNVRILCHEQQREKAVAGTQRSKKPSHDAGPWAVTGLEK